MDDFMKAILAGTGEAKIKEMLEGSVDFLERANNSNNTDCPILQEIKQGKHIWPEDEEPVRGEGFVLVREGDKK